MLTGILIGLVVGIAADRNYPGPVTKLVRTVQGWFRHDDTPGSPG